MFNQHITLENERVLLLPFSLEYKDQLRKVIFDPTIWTYMGLTIQTEEDLDTYLTSTIQERTNHKSYPFIIIDKMTNKVAGSTRFGNIHLNNKRLEIGWTWYGSSYQGTGLNHACKYELLKFAFEELGCNRVQFSADIENQRSQKAILKLGAKQEGIFRSNYIDEHGQARDDVYFSIVASEWDEVKKQYFQYTSQPV
ncbi:GNAT family N-acetyltransferase [Bacillus sp. BGMRC 2118]|nr:GNAT family N-acetyltransferase [Bacillus sp. BGMRC 2118]